MKRLFAVRRACRGLFTMLAMFTVFAMSGGTALAAALLHAHELAETRDRSIEVMGTIVDTETVATGGGPNGSMSWYQEAVARYQDHHGGTHLTRIRNDSDVGAQVRLVYRPEEPAKARTRQEANQDITGSVVLGSLLFPPLGGTALAAALSARRAYRLAKEPPWEEPPRIEVVGTVVYTTTVPEIQSNAGSGSFVTGRRKEAVVEYQGPHGYTHHRRLRRDYNVGTRVRLTHPPEEPAGATPQGMWTLASFFAILTLGGLSAVVVIVFDNPFLP